MYAPCRAADFLIDTVHKTALTVELVHVNETTAFLLNRYEDFGIVGIVRLRCRIAAASTTYAQELEVLNAEHLERHLRARSGPNRQGEL